MFTLRHRSPKLAGRCRDCAETGSAVFLRILWTERSAGPIIIAEIRWQKFADSRWSKLAKKHLHRGPNPISLCPRSETFLLLSSVHRNGIPLIDSSLIAKQLSRSVGAAGASNLFPDLGFLPAKRAGGSSINNSLCRPLDPGPGGTTAGQRAGVYDRQRYPCADSFLRRTRPGFPNDPVAIDRSPFIRDATLHLAGGFLAGPCPISGLSRSHRLWSDGLEIFRSRLFPADSFLR